ncbi:MAG: hypothetical protein IJ623_09800 [Bacteroidales bacterium]|nr:hypothetical protein [Bacteroidales bacterium]
MFEREDTIRNRSILMAMDEQVYKMWTDIRARKIETLRILGSWYVGDIVVFLKERGYVEVEITEDEVLVRREFDKDDDWSTLHDGDIDTVINRLAAGEVFKKERGKRLKRPVAPFRSRSLKGKPQA